MAHKIKSSTNWFAPDDTCWVLSGNVHFGSPGTYESPPEGDEVEFSSATEELEKDVQGPCRVLSFDDFIDLIDATEKDVTEMEDKFIEEAAEFHGDPYEPEPEYEAEDLPDHEEAMFVHDPEF
jgi:hypothetical protein